MSVSASLVVPSRRRPRWRELEIVDIARLNDQAVVVALEVPPHLREEFAFEPGQYLTLRAQIEGQDVRRSYSICMSRRAFAHSGRLRVASARVPTGLMSNWLNDSALAGQVVSVMPPMGDFTVPTQPYSSRHHVGVAAGSGITPVLSLITTVLEEEPRSRVTLIFGNKGAASTMFREELRALQAEYGDRFSLFSVLSQEPQEDELFAGRIDLARMRRFIERLVPVDEVDEWYLCGPHPMVTAVEEALAEAGADVDHVHHEIFHVETGNAVPSNE